MTKLNFERGYAHFIRSSAAQTGSNHGAEYIRTIEDCIDQYEHDINSFEGFQTGIEQLKGNIAEAHHADTFNISAALNGSSHRATILQSHDFASVDVATNFDKNYGLKYMFSPERSARAQATSYFEYYSKYFKGKMSFQDFLEKEGIKETDVLSDPIYQGQYRIIPADQLKEAIHFLKFKIAKESMPGNRPKEVFRYQETLSMLTDKIQDNDGNASIPLTNDEARRLARLAKEGEFNAKLEGLSTEELVDFHYLLHEGMKAGLTAATISVVLKTAPQLYQCLDELLAKGYVDEGRFRDVGIAAIEGGAEGFLRGSVASILTTACKGGLLGSSLKNVEPSVIAAVTVVTINSLKNSYLLASGKISRAEFVNRITRDVFITSCGVGFGALLGSVVPVVGCLLGNFVGTMVASFAIDAAYPAFMSFCCDTGYTFFGLVDQNYRLPKDVLDEIGIDVFEYEDDLTLKRNEESFHLDIFSPDEFKPDEYVTDTLDFIFLRRGVIGVRQIGYVKP